MPILWIHTILVSIVIHAYHIVQNTTRPDPFVDAHKIVHFNNLNGDTFERHEPILEQAKYVFHSDPSPTQREIEVRVLLKICRGEFVRTHAIGRERVRDIAYHILERAEMALRMLEDGRLLEDKVIMTTGGPADARESKHSPMVDDCRDVDGVSPVPTKIV